MGHYNHTNNEAPSIQLQFKYCHLFFTRLLSHDPFTSLIDSAKQFWNKQNHSGFLHHRKRKRLPKLPCQEKIHQLVQAKQQDMLLYPNKCQQQQLLWGCFRYHECLSAWGDKKAWTFSESAIFHSPVIQWHARTSHATDNFKIGRADYLARTYRDDLLKL